MQNRFIPQMLFLLVSCLPLYAQEKLSFPTQDGNNLSVLIMAPQGTGPFPAIVTMHGCAGLGGKSTALSARHLDWGQRLQAAGFLVVFPDSFGSRGLGSQCTTRKREIRAKDRAKDAFATAEWLAARPDVIKSRIGLLGWSNGGTAVLNATRTGQSPAGVDFKHAVAFYPGCTAVLKAGYTPRLPVTIMHGLADDWTSPTPCAALQGVEFIGYPDA